MIETLSNPMFYEPTAIGLLGVALWILSTWADPTDDTIAGTLSRAFGKHSRTLTVALFSYLGICVALYEADALTKVAAFTSGYMNQSLLTKLMDTYRAKIESRAANGG